MKIYDCSNSSERPANRGFGGSVENAVVTILKNYGPSIGMEFVDSIGECDIVFTNDVFPTNTWMNGKPKVKRMDGIFLQPELIERNIPYVKSCQMANHVIFVSNYSFQCYVEKYNNFPPRSKVILNWVDEDIFYPSPPRKEKNKPTNYVAVATSWARPEKGLSRLLNIAKMLRPEETLFLIGTIPEGIELPGNVKSLGYMSELRLANTLREMDVLINASENDAAPKVIPEAICCGLTVLCYQSGGCLEFLCFPDSTSRSFGYYFKYDSEIIDKLNYIRKYWKQFVTSSYSRWIHGERRTEALVNSYMEVFMNY